jgi:serine-protein kinase ATM
MHGEQATEVLKKARSSFKAQKVQKDPKILLNAFLHVRRRFKPVMRHFFTEKFKNPGDWFLTRLNYSRSVAVTSIAGHVLGLGDRHVNNILLDQSTGEVVHIDLGIAFDQVKLLSLMIDVYHSNSEGKTTSDS